MDPAVASQTGRVGKPLAASDVLALVRLLPGVCPDMNGEGAALDEALATAWRRARVGSLIRVYPVVPLEI
jgi:hypothetical protein